LKLAYESIFTVDGNYKGYTDTFEDLHGMAQLPGIASQRLMGRGLWLWRRGRLENCCPGTRHESYGKQA
jgi:L-arabinose isomerase